MFPINQILQGDCTRILPTLPSASIDLVITDPPYGVNYRDRLNRTIANDKDPVPVLAAFTDVYRVLKPHTFCISFYGYPALMHFASAWASAGFEPVAHIVWPKSYVSSSRYVQVSHESAYVLAKGRPQKPLRPLRSIQPWRYTGNKAHPTEKAASILRPLIESFSKPGDMVLDPFSGSGSTSIAAALSGRRYIGIELDAQYCEIARRRLSRLEPGPTRDSEELAVVDSFRSWLSKRGIAPPVDLIATLQRCLPR